MGLTIIDGKAYDLDAFMRVNGHPGGASLLLFEGSDASVAYHSIHPTHPRKHGGVHSSLIQFMVDGGAGNEIPLSACNGNLVFDSEFANNLVSVVYAALWRHRRELTVACNWYILRSVVYTLMYIISAYAWVTNPSIVHGLSFGTTTALMALNIAHDASHGALGGASNIAAKLFDVFGSSSLHWFQQHIMRHHPFTNNYSCDKDISAAEPMIYYYTPAVQKKYDRYIPIHLKFQHYIWFIWHQLYTLVVNIEAYQIKKYPDVHVNKQMIYDARQLLPIRVGTKLLWFFIPMYTSQYTLITYLFHYYIMMATSSLILTTLFMVSHNFEGVNKDDKAQGDDSTCWYMRQIGASCTYGGRVAGALTGGLNYQIEHHLFQKTPSYAYPIIQPYIRAVCEQHNVRYTYFPTMYENLKSAMKHLKINKNMTLDDKDKQHTT